MYYVSVSEMITQKQLADKMSLKEPTVVRLVDKIQALGWITRINNKDDKRIKILKLTENGKKIETEMLDVAEKFRNDVICDIPSEELDIYNSVLRKMLINIEKG